eukprot:1793838-Pyramimonas_sp.AAC.1
MGLHACLILCLLDGSAVHAVNRPSRSSRGSFLAGSAGPARNCSCVVGHRPRVGPPETAASRRR